MSSPTVRRSPSLKSLSDSEVNIDMSDLQDNEQRHQQTVKRFSILSGIEDELNRKLQQKPLGINSIIIQEDEEQSIQKSKENEDWNKKTVSHTITQNIGAHKYQKPVQINNPKKQYSSNRYATENQNQYQQNQYHQVIKKTSPQQKPNNKIVKPCIYKIRKQINLLETPAPIVHHPRAFHKQQPQESNQSQQLFTMALQTQRRKQMLWNYRHY